MTTVPEELSRTPEFQDKRNGQSFSYGDYRPSGLWIMSIMTTS